MILKINDLEEQYVIIENDGSDKVLWNDFCNFIGDIVRFDGIRYNAKSIIFKWNIFLSIKSYLREYLCAHNSQITLIYSDSVRKLLQKNKVASYEESLGKTTRTKETILSILEAKGFSRSLTKNQLTNIEKISMLNGAATFSVPGAGKTTEALAFFFVNCEENDRLFVVAPKNAFGAWEEQLSACFPNKPYEFVRLRGGDGAIREALRSQPRFMIISYDQFYRVIDTITSIFSEDNVFMFLDESHRIKGGKQTKRAEAVLSIAHRPKKKLIMSGTPMPQGPKDLLPQFSFLYPSKYVEENNVISLIQPVFVRTNKGELGIPEVEHKVKIVKMGELQRKIYDTLKSEFKRQFNSSLSDLSKFELKRIGKSVIKVMEFVSNPSLLASDISYAFDERVGQLLLNSDGPKIDYVCRRVRSLASEGKKVLIWSSFVKNVELLAFRLRDLGAEYIHGGVETGDDEELETREGKIKRFHSDPNCMVLVANPAACSEGISLHKVCQNAIYLDRSFNAAQYLQSEDRIHRLGLPKDAHPIVEFVECENSIDQVISARLQYKVKTMANALNDSSLKVDPSCYEYDDEESEIDELNMEDARAVIAYFFKEESNND